MFRLGVCFEIFGIRCSETNRFFTIAPLLSHFRRSAIGLPRVVVHMQLRELLQKVFRRRTILHLIHTSVSCNRSSGNYSRVDVSLELSTFRNTSPKQVRLCTTVFSGSSVGQFYTSYIREGSGFFAICGSTS